MFTRDAPDVFRVTFYEEGKWFVCIYKKEQFSTMENCSFLVVYQNITIIISLTPCLLMFGLSRYVIRLT